jgi:Taurine catabolism dioxygenase TauD, TfdA family
MEQVDRPVLRKPVSDGSAWTRDELAADRSWTRTLDRSLVDEVEQALEGAKRAGLHHTEIKSEAFPLPSAKKLFDWLARELERGRGVAVVSGVPVEGKDVADCELLFAGLSSHLGVSVVQDTAGTHIDHVVDQGLSYDNITVRGYRTRAQLTPHCDSSDATTLLCLRQARTGGVNTVSSSLAVYNTILEHHPELLEVLYEGFHYNTRAQGPPGPYRDLTSHRVPVFSYHAGRLSCRFNEKGILTSEQLDGAPRLTEQERHAIDVVARLACEPRYSVDVLLQPGDWLLMCNYTVFHNRSAYEDFPEPERKRLLLRKWLNLPNGRELTWEFGDHFETGIRQGPYVPGEPGQTVGIHPLGSPRHAEAPTS